MRRAVNLTLALALALGAVWVFELKMSAEGLSDKVALTVDQIAEEKIKISILKAERSLLTQPERLQRLAERYSDVLALDVIDPDQVARISQLPFRRSNVAQSYSADGPNEIAKQGGSYQMGDLRSENMPEMGE